jgi:hypothetical protein
MKNRKALGFVLALAVLVAACKSSQYPSTNAAYTGMYASISTVQSAISVFKQMKAKGMIDDPLGSKERSVQDAYFKFQKSVDFALAMAVDVTQEKKAEEMVRDAMLLILPVIDAFTGARR